jgi:hypothetical protein
MNVMNMNFRIAFRPFSERLLWVTSSLSAAYHSTGCFRVHARHSEADFSGRSFERLLSSKAATRSGE